MDPFHDETGFLLWDEVNGQVMRVVVFGSGIAVIAGADAGIYDTELNFSAVPGDDSYCILQNRHLMQNAKTKRFESTNKINGFVTYHTSSSLQTHISYYDKIT